MNSSNITMKKLLKDPLLHFLIVGAALFLFFELSRGVDDTADNTIHITRGDIEALQANFFRTWQRQPTDTEKQGLIAEKVRGEIAYREALAMSLDQNDAYIRRRLRMKLELLVEDIGTLNPPTEEELTAFLHNNREAFALEPQMSFSHVYFRADNPGKALEGDILNVLNQLNIAEPHIKPEDYGDSTMLPMQFPLSPVSVIKRQFGAQFGEGLVTQEPGNWQGPIRSTYGLHLVLVGESIKGRIPDLAEVRPAVEREFMAKQRKEIKEKMYNELRQRYRVKIEQEQESGT